jgi:hypothetical protein
MTPIAPILTAVIRITTGTVSRSGMSRPRSGPLRSVAKKKKISITGRK